MTPHRLKTPALSTLADTAQKVIYKTEEKTVSLWTDFKNFVGKGNILQISIAFIVGAKFQEIVTSLVNDIFTPILGLGPNINFDEAFVVLKGPKGKRSVRQFSSAAAAKEAGAVVMTYGHFFTVLINFVIVALLLYIIFRIVMAFMRKAPPAPTCPLCKCEIKAEAKRCQWCCADIKEE